MSPTTRRKSSCTRTSRGRKLLLPLCIGCGESGVIHAEALSSRESRTKGIAALDSKVINLVSTDSRVSSKVEGINDAVADVVQPAIDAVQPAVDAIKPGIDAAADAIEPVVDAVEPVYTKHVKPIQDVALDITKKYGKIATDHVVNAADATGKHISRHVRQSFATVHQGAVSAVTALSSLGEGDARFAIASSASGGQVVYARLGLKGNGPVRPLIETGLQTPGALAVDTTRKLLYIADAGAKKVFRYELKVDGEKLGAIPKGFVADAVDAVAVTVDSSGDIFLVDGVNGKVLRADEQHKTAPAELYAVDTLPAISGVTGLFADNFSLYWANGSSGKSVGSVVRAPQRPPLFKRDGSQPPGVGVLTKKADAASGVCAAGGDAIFFTSSTGSLFRGVRGMTETGTVLELDSGMSSPSQCAWEKGTSSLLVVDQSAVYRYGGILSDQVSGPSALSSKVKIFDIAGGSGVAFFSPPDQMRGSGMANSGSWVPDFFALLFSFTMVAALTAMAKFVAVNNYK
ncbi:unnamed protein product [Amoebophrya sp. A25]|nr:unnamed protein product [Amoebophrya sp. A25]|eukprot:GSA25T00020941001.1